MSDQIKGELNVSRKKITLLMAVVCVMLVNTSATAEDIDLFAGVDRSSAINAPNVLIILDNAANFSSSAATCKFVDNSDPSLNGTAGGIEQCAFYNVIDGLPTNANDTAMINLGIMAYNATNIRDINGENCGGSTGGCLMVPLMPMNSTNKAKVQAWIKSWTTTGGEDSGYVKANGESTGAVQQEAWAYFAGKTGLSGRNYAATRPASACGKNYIIFVANAFTTNGTPGESGSLTASPPLWGEASAEMNAVPVATDAQKTLITGTLKTSCTSGTSGSSSGSYTFPSSRTQHDKGDYADEWTRYMNQTLGIITYTVGLLNADRTKCKPQYPALLSSMATVGLGKYFETDNYADLKTAFDTALSEIQAINSVFASPAYR